MSIRSFLIHFLFVSVLFFSYASNAAIKWVRIGNANPDFKTTITIAWHSDAACTGIVKYGFDINYGSTFEVQPIATADFGFMYEATITGLEPGRLYHYRVGCDSQGWSDDGVFITESSNECSSFSFVVGGDSRGDLSIGGFYLPSTVWPGVFTEAANLNPAFVVNTGDLVRDGKEASQWAKFLDTTTPIWRIMRLFWVIGNHDDDEVEGPDAKVNIVSIAPKNPVTHSEDFYSFDYGLAHFVILSTETFNEDRVSTQTQWLEQDLSSTDRPWKFAFFHRPFYTSGSHSPNEDNRSGPFVPILEAHGVDVVFCGHNHVYERFAPIKDELIKPYGEGTVYITAGGGGALLDYLYATRSKDPRLENWKLEFGFVEMKISASVEERTTTLTAIYHRTATGNTGGGASSMQEFSYSKPLPTSVCSSSADGDEDTATETDNEDLVESDTNEETLEQDDELSDTIELDVEREKDTEILVDAENDNPTLDGESRSDSAVDASDSADIADSNSGDEVSGTNSGSNDSGCASQDFSVYFAIMMFLFLGVYRRSSRFD